MVWWAQKRHPCQQQVEHVPCLLALFLFAHVPNLTAACPFPLLNTSVSPALGCLFFAADITGAAPTFELIIFDFFSMLTLAV